MNKSNKSKKTIQSFGDEWKKFDQSNIDKKELDDITARYFNIFPKENLNKNAVGFDLGCGSGRFAFYVADKVKTLHCIEPSEAIEISKKKLSNFNNCIFHSSSVEDLKLEDESMDFGFSLGVLHHTLDPLYGLKQCSRILKKNAPFLLYLYYSFDNKPLWFKFLWKLSNYFRLVISIMPKYIKFIITDIIALTIYLPLARFAKLLENIFNLNVENFPLSAYRNLNYYTMRTDSLDRFGTRIEKRFSKKEIESMLLEAGFNKIKFSDKIPYWIAIGYKK
tara:strand:- start:11435 stop:12268 length:834 start_codon:yes stop_codon:yes gene_type:complete